MVYKTRKEAEEKMPGVLMYNACAPYPYKITGNKKMGYQIVRKAWYEQHYNDDIFAVIDNPI